MNLVLDNEYRNRPSVQGELVEVIKAIITRQPFQNGQSFQEVKEKLAYYDKHSKYLTKEVFTLLLNHYKNYPEGLAMIAGFAFNAYYFGSQYSHGGENYVSREDIFNAMNTYNVMRGPFFTESIFFEKGVTSIWQEMLDQDFISIRDANYIIHNNKESPEELTPAEIEKLMQILNDRHNEKIVAQQNKMSRCLTRYYRGYNLRSKGIARQYVLPFRTLQQRGADRRRALLGYRAPKWGSLQEGTKFPETPHKAFVYKA